jgi:nicotinate-nucleotide pyrophosphorylase (carboxylating)
MNPSMRAVVGIALAEDLQPLGDLTASLIPPGRLAVARFASRAPGVVAGLECAVETYAQLDPSVSVSCALSDGDCVSAGASIGLVRGPLAAIVTGERTALNFLRHLSGVATMTARFVALASAASGGRTRILDTRKTTPGLRALEKAAVRAGGGHNHRGNLSDGIMLKDNHLLGLDLRAAVASARSQWPGRPVHVECDTLDQVQDVVAAGADRAMLDNMTPSQVAAAISLVGGAVEVEVTGGVTLETVAEYAAAGPDFISVGAITHSAGVLDIGLDLFELFEPRAATC